MADKPGRDRSGEPFEDNFTEDRGVRRPKIEQSQHKLDMEGESVSRDDRKEHHGSEKV